jgi:hypothetical protein
MAIHYTSSRMFAPYECSGVGPQAGCPCSSSSGCLAPAAQNPSPRLTMQNKTHCPPQLGASVGYWMPVARLHATKRQQRTLLHAQVSYPAATQAACDPEYTPGGNNKHYTQPFATSQAPELAAGDTNRCSGKAAAALHGYSVVCCDDPHMCTHACLLQGGRTGTSADAPHAPTAAT